MPAPLSSSSRIAGPSNRPASTAAYSPATARAVPCPMITGISAVRPRSLLRTSGSRAPGGLPIARRYISGCAS